MVRFWASNCELSRKMPSISIKILLMLVNLFLELGLEGNEYMARRQFQQFFFRLSIIYFHSSYFHSTPILIVVATYPVNGVPHCSLFRKSFFFSVNSKHSIPYVPDSVQKKITAIIAVI